MVINVSEESIKVATKEIYAYCQRCKGTGKISLSNGDEPPVVITCGWCDGAGKILFGEMAP